MNKDILQTVKNLIRLKDQIGYFPEDLNIQNSFLIYFLYPTCNKLIKFISNDYYEALNHGILDIGDNKFGENGTSIKYIFLFKGFKIALFEYQDYLRGLQMVLENTSFENIAEFYLIRQEKSPVFGNETTPPEPIEYIEYADEIDIAYFQEINEGDIKDIEQNVLELLEKEIHK